MLGYAFKEWAAICNALAAGRQSIILRKGGIAEAKGGFQLEHTRFWLFPTYVHQQSSAIKPEALPLLHQAELERPSFGTIRLTHFAEVTGVYHLHDIVGALLLDPLHVWSAETVQARFTYRHPGLYVLAARVYRAAEAHDLADTPYYAGCRSWVELEEELPTEGANPILDDAAYEAVLRRLDTLLNPTGLA
jgi:hypothetical protein